MSRSALVTLAFALASCVPSVFHCDSDSECVRDGVQGTCGGGGFCNFADPGCASGKRIGDSTGLGACVAAADLSVQLTAASCPPATPNFCAGDLGAFCTSFATDPQNCGACGNACDADQYCARGACVDECPLTACGNVCTDLATDANHCGACDTACAAGQFCASGTCACPQNQTLCNGTCVEENSDPAHCGSCDNACSSAQFCNAGTCAPICALTVCGSDCVDTQNDSTHCGDCGTTCNTAGGEFCVCGTCGCGASNLTDCSGTCADLSSDPFFCGSCSQSCSLNVPIGMMTGCSSGQCTCNGVVANFMQDPNCGGCGITCDIVAGPDYCCTLGMCGSAGDPAPGFQTDPNNCGGCGIVCDTDSGASCVSGVCGCNGQPVNFQTDNNNCGTCGNACDTSNGNGCVQGQCDCDGQPTNLQTDPENCGTCGNSCDNPHHAPICNGGQCAP